MTAMKVSTRRKFVGGILGAGSVATAAVLMSWMRKGSEVPLSQENPLAALPELPKQTDRMPVVFVGHGTPRSAVWTNQWTDTWELFGARLPRPAAILSISAHWLTQRGALVTASANPRMNYDFYGFPQEMYQVVYPAPGNIKLAEEIQTLAGSKLPVSGDGMWGFDHGTWVVLKYMFPKADIPVIQLSIDYSQPPSFHYELGQTLQALRNRGVLILGSGNIVHNLSIRPGMNNDRPYDWAVEFDATMWKNIQDGNHQAVVNFQNLGSVAEQSHPTYDHFLPLLYCLGLKKSEDAVTTFNDNFQWPAVSMRSLLIA
jgi:4,5-DOPA dioxygenase extradiol